MSSASLGDTAAGYGRKAWWTPEQHFTFHSQNKRELLDLQEERVRVGMDGQPVLDGQKKPLKELVRLERPKMIAGAVFNAQQIDGIPALEQERTYNWDPIEQAEKAE
jgi:antirestriction protein ArdC